MRDAYISLGKQCFPNAKIAIDPFHYKRYFTEAVQKVRRRITDSDNLTENMKWLKQHWRLLTLSTSNLRKLKVDQQYHYDLEEKKITMLSRQIVSFSLLFTPIKFS